ncbi:hypothetical protein ACFYYL_17040 [Actinomadura geliboluensis]|uniref:hypothetical protein n=1 Tax=Actinomadura geliboluensis TaxID=882440 RepID=UPI00368A2466
MLPLVISYEPPNLDVRFDWVRNGLVDVTGQLIGIWTGAHTGDVHVTLDVRAHSPEQFPPTEEWDEVVEASFASSTGSLAFNWDPEYPDLDLGNPGSYRVRVHARGRERAGRHSGVTPVEDAEQVLLVLWPEAERPEEVIKTTDAVGERLRTPPRDLSAHGTHYADGIKWVCVREGLYRLGDDESGPSTATVSPGIVNGQIAFRIEVTLGAHGRQAPPEQNFDDWDDIIEFSLDVKYAVVHEWDGTRRTDLGNLCQHGPGEYRFRLHARKRNDLLEHLLQSWPAPLQNDNMLKSAGGLEII